MAAKKIKVLVPNRNVVPRGKERTLYGGAPYEVGRDVSAEDAQRIVERGAGRYLNDTPTTTNLSREELEARAAALGVDPSEAKNKAELVAAINKKEVS